MMADNIIWLDFNDAPDQPALTPSDTETLRQGLLERLEDALHHLFPQGRIRGTKFTIGDVEGNPGKSLVVELKGERRGLWKDFATDEGGDVIDLWARSRGLSARHDFPRLAEEIRHWLGLAPPPESTAVPPHGPSAPLDELGPHTAKWDYRSAEGKLLACVYRYDPPSGKAYRPWDVRAGLWRAPDPRPLYNLPGLVNADTVVLVEGEKCAEALIEAGIAATTAMQGAQAPVEKTEWTPLAGKALLVWPDKDKPGWRYAEAAGHAALAAGAHSCTILIPPENKPEKWDAADALPEGFDAQGFIATGERITLKPPVPETTEEPEPAVWGSEDALALDFTRRYAEDWRYVALWGKWLVWTRNRWQVEQTLGAAHLIRQICRDVASRASQHRVAVKLASSGTASGAERFARTDRRHAATVEEWDADPWHLNTLGGVVDLRTGGSRSHRREDRMTKITTATPQGNCPTWRAFLEEVTGNDAELIAYLQRMAGYCLTGITTEHALFFLYGTGANGKSVFVNTLYAILGDYATNAPMDTFMETRSDRHPTDLAGLRGARFVSSIETEQGRRWAESKLKALTGGDKIAARFMRQDFFEYVPQFKLVIAGNHKPAIRNIDEAMRRRLHLVPFTVTIPEDKRDQKLTEKLLRERDGILAWAVEGCLDWQRTGLKPPKCVQEATEEYFEGEDAIGRWIDERCVIHVNAKALVADLYADWKTWAEAAGEYVGSIRRFSELLVNRQFRKWRNSVGSRGFEGIGLRQTPCTTYPYKDD